MAEHDFSLAPEDDDIIDLFDIVESNTKDLGSQPSNEDDMLQQAIQKKRDEFNEHMNEESSSVPQDTPNVDLMSNFDDLFNELDSESKEEEPSAENDSELDDFLKNISSDNELHPVESAEQAAETTKTEDSAYDDLDALLNSQDSPEDELALNDLDKLLENKIHDVEAQEHAKSDDEELDITDLDDILNLVDGNIDENTVNNNTTDNLDEFFTETQQTVEMQEKNEETSLDDPLDSLNDLDALFEENSSSAETEQAEEEKEEAASELDDLAHDILAEAEIESEDSFESPSLENFANTTAEIDDILEAAPETTHEFMQEQSDEPLQELFEEKNTNLDEPEQEKLLQEEEIQEEIPQSETTQENATDQDDEIIAEAPLAENILETAATATFAAVSASPEPSKPAEKPKPKITINVSKPDKKKIKEEQINKLSQGLEKEELIELKPAEEADPEDKALLLLNMQIEAEKQKFSPSTDIFSENAISVTPPEIPEIKEDKSAPTEKNPQVEQIISDYNLLSNEVTSLKTALQENLDDSITLQTEVDNIKAEVEILKHDVEEIKTSLSSSGILESADLSQAEENLHLKIDTFIMDMSDRFDEHTKGLTAFEHRLLELEKMSTQMETNLAIMKDYIEMNEGINTRLNQLEESLSNLDSLVASAAAKVIREEIINLISLDSEKEEE